MDYAELHCHSYYSFHDGASSLEELMLRSKELGYRALAVTDHNNLCGAMRFAQLSHSLEMQGIIGVEITLEGSGALIAPLFYKPYDRLSRNGHSHLNGINA